MLRILRQPYPVEETLGRHLFRATLIGLFVGLFLLIFQPFGLSIWETEHKTWKILGFGAVTFVMTATNYLAWRAVPGAYTDARWTVGREIGHISLTLLSIAVGNLLYLNALGVLALHPLNLLWTLTSTLLIGIFPITATVIANYIVRLKRYSRQAAALPLHPLPPAGNVVAGNGTPTTLLTNEAVASDNVATLAGQAGATTLSLVAENEKDVVTLTATDLLFIESSDNYCTVVYVKNGQPAKVLLRSSLSRMESQLADAAAGRPNPFVRCHRSYVVNLDRVERITGNAQGYKLHLHGGTYQVPVARKYNDTLVAGLKA